MTRKRITDTFRAYLKFGGEARYQLEDINAVCGGQRHDDWRERIIL